MRRRIWMVTLPLVAVTVAGLGWAGFAPIEVTSREQAFDIPQGTFARRRAGDLVEILPNRIRLTLGLKDLLVIRNHDDVPQVFGPTLMMPGQSFSLPFERAASYQFVCSAHASGQLTIDVEPEPVTPWARIRWRALDWLEKRRK
jgi:hypothetical protein